MNGLLQQISPLYHYSTFAYHDSWLSIDPIVGCPNNCRYCFMQVTRWTGSSPEVVIDPATTVERLLLHPLFIPHETVLSFGNQTDPFLAYNTAYLLDFTSRFDAVGYKNPLALVTKCLIPDAVIDHLQALKNVRVLFFLSYSRLPKRIERGVNPADNESNFKRLSLRGLPVIHFWRPLLAVNGTPEIIRQVLDTVTPYSLASVYIGIKLSPELSNVYSDTPEFQVPISVLQSFGTYLSYDIEKTLRGIASAVYPDYPLYQHTSCAVSLALRTPDYTATVLNKRVCFGSNCPPHMRQMCTTAAVAPTEAEVRGALSSLGIHSGFTVMEDHVMIESTVSQEHFTYLLHRLRFPIRVRGLRQTRNLIGSIFLNSVPTE